MTGESASDSPPNIRVRVPATTANLGPGFDAFGAAVDCYLHALTEPREGSGPRVETRGHGADEVPEGDDNLIWRCFVALHDHVGAPVPDLRVVVNNDIPLERGLGSSSAAIVAGLSLARGVLRHTAEVALSDLEICELATEREGHPDNVVPAVVGGLTVSAVDDNGALVVRRVTPHTRLRPVVWVPEDRQLTTAARAVLPESLDRAAVAEQAARAGHVAAGLAGAWPVAAGLAGDYLHEPARLRAMAPSGALVAGLRAQGVHAWLSGAGPSVAAALPTRGGPMTEDVDGFVRHDLGFELSGTVICAEGGCAFSGIEGCRQCPARGL